MSDRFVDAYDKNTGQKLEHPVPESYFDIFKNLRKTPIQKAADKAAGTKTQTKES